MKKTIFVAAASAIVLAACVVMQAQQAGAPRETTVTVDGAYIVIDQDPIVVHGKNVTIVWRLVASGYTFPSDGVVISNPGGEFACQPKGSIFLCQDRNSQPGRYKYTIKVVPAGGGAPYTFDPTIMND